MPRNRRRLPPTPSYATSWGYRRETRSKRASSTPIEIDCGAPEVEAASAEAGVSVPPTNSPRPISPTAQPPRTDASPRRSATAPGSGGPSNEHSEKKPAASGTSTERGRSYVKAEWGLCTEHANAPRFAKSLSGMPELAAVLRGNVFSVRCGNRNVRVLQPKEEYL
jgi:hypothetical protein